MIRSGMRNGSRRSGAALILASGVIVLTMLLVVMLLGTGRIAWGRTRASLQGIQARLAVASGLDYAAARLWRGGDRVPASARSMANAGDDWAFRDPLATPVGGLSNPSYAHGERWDDTPLTNGAYDALSGEFLPAADRDGDGRFDACSGRLRDGKGGVPFLLKVQGTAGLACVNSGELGSPLGDHDLDGVLNADDTDYGEDLDTDGEPANGIQANGVPDWRDPDFVGNVHLVNLLDNLGAVVGLPLVAPAPLYAPFDPNGAALGAIEVSDLGRRVVANRPRGGYDSLAQVAAFLPPAEYALVEPFLTTRGEILPVAFTLHTPDAATYSTTAYGVHLVRPEARYEFHARVRFNDAPVEVLKAILRYVSSGYRTPFFRGRFSRLYADPSSPGGSPAAGDEVAQALIDARAVGGIYTWRQMASALRALPPGFFRDDPFTQTDESVPGNRGEREDLILAQLAGDGYFPDPWHIRWNALEVDGSARLISKADLSGPLSTCQYDASGVEDPAGPRIERIPARLTTECSLAGGPPAHFLVACAGFLEGHRAEILTDLSLEAAPFVMTSQQDFDPHNVLPGSPWRYPGGVFRCDGDVIAERTGIQVSPRFPFVSGRLPGVSNYTAASVDPALPPEVLANDRYPRALEGALQLAARPWQPDELREPVSGCVFALPGNEDDFSSIGAAYDPNDYRDNLFDPGAPFRGSPPSSQSWTDLLPDGSGVPGKEYPSFHAGVVWAPEGPRCGAAKIEWPLFPLPRKGAMRMGGIDGGTIEFVAPVIHSGGGITGGWQETPGKDYVDAGRIALSIWGDQGLGAGPEFIGYLSIQLKSGGNVEIRDAGLGATRLFLVPPAVRQLTRHHVAVKFDGSADPDPRKTQVTVYYDGILSPTMPLVVSIVHPVLTPRIRGIVTYPIGDPALFAPPHDAPAKITERAQRGAHLFDPATLTAAGRYVSPLFSMTRESRPRFLTWDCFIPTGTGGSVTLSVHAYDDAGNLLAQSVPVSWSGTGPQTAPSGLDVRCAKFRIEAAIGAADGPLDPWPLVGDPATGSAKPTLLDTPILTECAIRWGLDRPLWGPVSVR